MPKYCHYHPETEAFKECENCGRILCYKCSMSYWKTNALSHMFSAQKNEKEKLILCPLCLRKSRIRNAVISGLLLILVLGIIAGSIFYAIV